MACDKRKDRRLWLARRLRWRGRWRFAQGLPSLQPFAVLATGSTHPWLVTRLPKPYGEAMMGSLLSTTKVSYQVPTQSGIREKSKAAGLSRQRRRPSSTLIQHNWFHWPCSSIITVNNSARGLDRYLGRYICGIGRLYHCQLPSQTCVSQAKHRQASNPMVVTGRSTAVVMTLDVSLHCLRDRPASF